MAPRSRARAALQANIVVPAVKVTELPEAVLATCLAHLDLKQRLGPVSLACKRFAAAALSPELLREMDVELMSLPAVRSFAAFLARHGQQLQRLKLHCDDETEEGGAAAAAAVTACLSFAGAGRQLVELRVSGRICSTEWLVAMPLLRRLELQSWDEGSRLHVSSAIRSLSALSVLQLSGNLSFPAGKRLPPSLKWLSLESDGSAALPKQVAQLPRLSSLSLRSCGYSPASLGALSRLSGRLTRLEISNATIPGSLSALTKLRHLRLWGCDTPEGDDAVLSAALTHLRQLKRLIVFARGAAVPAALAGLPNLQLCYLDIVCNAAPPLPAGPWLASLRWLHYNVDGLVVSTAALQAAAALDFLEGSTFISKEVDWSSPAADAFFDWLAQHPPLRRVYFDAAEGGAFDSGVFATHVMRLAGRRPSLELEGDAEPDMRDLIDEK